MFKNSKFQGFTLIEILVVVGLIAILATITVVALNPAQRFAESRDATRSTHLNNISSSIAQFLADGNAISGLGTIVSCDDGSGGTQASPIGTDGALTNGVDLEAVLSPEYIAEIPTDPNGGTSADTGYDICETAGGRLSLTAPGGEIDTNIEVTF